MTSTGHQYYGRNQLLGEPSGFRGTVGYMNKASAIQQPVALSSTSNVRIRSLEPLVPPADLLAAQPLAGVAASTVVSGRRAVEEVLAGDDLRLLAVVGPCSIHDIDAARDYAKRLKSLADRVADKLLVVMRVYFEKPRTTVGWKGLINDPHLDDSFDISMGLQMARSLLIEVSEMGLATATEFLEPITPQFLVPLALVQQKAQRIAKWRVAYRCQLALRIQLMVHFKQRLMQCRQHARHIAFWALIMREEQLLSQRQEIPGGFLCSVVAAVAPTTQVQ